MATAPHPHSVNVPLPAAARTRWPQVVRGAGIALVVALVSSAIIVLLDFLGDLSIFTRCLLQLAWLGGIGFVFWRFIIQPWREETAAASPAPTSILRWSITSVLLLVSAVSALAIVPGSGERLRRVALPWYRATSAVSYRVVVSSGNPIMKRGNPLTLSAYLARSDAAAAIPDSAVLIYRTENDDNERRLPMTGDGSGSFHVTLPAVFVDLEYRVEVETATSDWFHVLVADPVELAPGTTAEITPPQYAIGLPSRTIQGLGALHGFQSSTASLRLRFTRPAAAAFLEWQPADAGDRPGTVIPLTLDAARREGTAEFALTQNGTLRVVLVNEDGPRKLRTDVPVAVWVTPDAAPRFEELSGITRHARLVRPNERIAISLTAIDDLSVASVELEYAVGPAFQTIRVPVTLTGAKSSRVLGRVPFDFTGKAIEGQTLRLRLRIMDSHGQETFYPPAFWSELTVTASAPPLDQQDIFGQRDALRESLLAGLKDVRTSIEELKAVRDDPDDGAQLPLHHRIRIDRARERCATALERLETSAEDAALTPDLRPFARAVRETSDTHLRDANEHLRKAATDNAAARTAALAAADRELTAARVKIENLLTRNARLAQDRFDRRRIEGLNADQVALIEKARAGAPREELAKAQEEFLKRLRVIISESDALRRGTDFAAGREARQLAAETRELAAAVGELDRAAHDLSDETRKALLARAGEAQAENATAAAALLARIESAARIAGIAPPRPEDFRRVSDLIAQDKLVEALIELEKLAADLDRVAVEFDRWAVERVDAKNAAKQLAVWQDDLRGRVQAATRESPFAQLPDAVKMRFRLEQRTIRDSAARLRLPTDPEVVNARGAVVLALNRAADELDGDGNLFDVSMKTASAALVRLEERTPTVRDRLAGARGELEKIRGEQESQFTVAELFIRPTLTKPIDAAAMQELAKKLAIVQEKQQKLAERLVALDLPGFEARQARAVFALRAAAADLRDGVPFDSIASLHWAKREVDRLKVALDTPPVVDDRANQLAAMQAAIAQDVAALGPNPTAKQLEPLNFAQRDVSRQLEKLLAPEAPALLNDAKVTVELAEVAKSDEARRRITAAAAVTLKRLADRLNAVESDCDRLKRLAANRLNAAEEAKKLLGKPRNPAASDEARRQLLREVEELTHTRVGAAGQALKQRVLRLYGSLHAQGEPDRQAGAQKELADALDELAGKAAESPALAAGWPREKEPAVPPPEAAYLPSKSLADAVRDLAKRQRQVRDRVSAVNAEAARLTQPAATDPLGALEQRQRSLADELADLFRNTLAKKDAASAESASKALNTANLSAHAMALGQVPTAKQHAEATAERLRQLAASGEGKSWAKAVRELSAKQDAIVADFNALTADSNAIAARLNARRAELCKTANDLVRRLDAAARELLPGDASGQKLHDAANDVRVAESLLKNDRGNPTQANARLVQAADKAAAAGGLKPGTPIPLTPTELATSDSLLETEQAMKVAARELGPNGDPAAAVKSMQKAANALRRAGQSIGER